ncbi:AfsR/SARP family transcriptional regulator [Actinoplanes sp. URMC 104]|uniref:AfsR/SARP family transcriptional regulator n=1 Tax=Actinoplanes sp. URMC 104 TaxID=3423409 RepID=UPI003F1AC193
MTTVRVRVFGGLRLWREGSEIEIGSTRVRTVLAVLLAARGATVTTAELVDTLWGEQPSASAVNQIQRLIGQVRRLFEPDLTHREAGTWLLPVGEGYRLRQDARTSDLMAFFELAAAARAAGDSPDAVGKFEQALTLAQGQPFAGLPANVLELPPFTAIETAQADVALRALHHPRADRLLPLLTGYAQAAPFHEPLQAGLIRLLTAAGRRAEALTHYEQVRQRLADELGADPGAELQAAHLDALTDPEGVDGSRPAQLPLRVGAFSPRDDLTAALDSGRRAGIVVLSGMGGAGKTALAVDWAHRIAGDYPDGQLYLDLRGFAPGGRQLRPAEALTTLLISLGSAPTERDDMDALCARFRSALAGRRMIVLLDNARDSAQVRPLLPGSPGCLIVITSRNRMPSLVAREGAWPVHVGRVGRSAARDMLARRLGADRLAAEPGAADKLVELCAGLPLALSIAAARIAVSPGESLADVVADLDSPGHRLDVLDTGEENDSVRSAFSWSYAVLSQPAARLFRLLAVYPDTDVAADTAASIAGADVRGELTELTVMNILTPLGAGRYTAHDLLKAYAAELIDDERDGRLDAERRLVEHYVHASYNAYLTFQLLPPTRLGSAPADVFPPRPEDVPAALDWYGRERRAVLAVADLALDRGWSRDAALIIMHSRPMRASRLDTTKETRRQSFRVVDALRELGDPEIETAFLREAALQAKFAEPDRARDYLMRALAIAESRADVIGQAQVLRNLAQPPITLGPQQIPYAERAVAAARQSGEPSVLLYAHDALATAREENGDLAGAAVASDEAFDVATAAGIQDARSSLASERARLALRLGDNRAAVRWGEWALARVSSDDHHVTFGATMVLAQAYHRIGDTARARTAAQRAHELVQGREAEHAASFGPEYFATFMAEVDAVLADDGTAKGDQ